MNVYIYISMNKYLHIHSKIHPFFQLVFSTILNHQKAANPKTSRQPGRILAAASPGAKLPGFVLVWSYHHLPFGVAFLKPYGMLTTFWLHSREKRNHFLAPWNHWKVQEKTASFWYFSCEKTRQKRLWGLTISFLGGFEHVFWCSSLVGEMMQCDLRIIFWWVGEKPPTRCVFRCLCSFNHSPEI